MPTQRTATSALPLPATVPVAGVTRYRGPVADLRPGDRLEVVAEPDNPADVNACALRDRAGRTVGYVPADLAARLRVAGAGPWTATVADVVGSGRLRGLRVTIVGPVCRSEPTVVLAVSGQPLGRYAATVAGGRLAVVDGQGRRLVLPQSICALR